MKIPEHRAVPFRQPLYNLDQLQLVLYGVDQSRDFSHALAAQISRMALVGHAVVMISATFWKNVLDLLVVKEDRANDRLQLCQVETASARGNVNMATAS